MARLGTESNVSDAVEHSMPAPPPEAKFTRRRPMSSMHGTVIGGVSRLALGRGASETSNCSSLGPVDVDDGSVRNGNNSSGMKDDCGPIDVDDGTVWSANYTKEDSSHVTHTTWDESLTSSDRPISPLQMLHSRKQQKMQHASPDQSLHPPSCNASLDPVEDESRRCVCDAECCENPLIACMEMVEWLTPQKKMPQHSSVECGIAPENVQSNRPRTASGYAIYVDPPQEAQTQYALKQYLASRSYSSRRSVVKHLDDNEDDEKSNFYCLDDEDMSRGLAGYLEGADVPICDDVEEEFNAMLEEERTQRQQQNKEHQSLQAPPTRPASPSSKSRCVNSNTITKRSRANYVPLPATIPEQIGVNAEEVEVFLTTSHGISKSTVATISSCCYNCSMGRCEAGKCTSSRFFV